MPFARRSGGKPAKAMTRSPLRTRTFSQRDDDAETVYQVTLDERRLKVRWGKPGGRMRVQQFRFPSVADARDDYLKRVDDLLAKGFLDAS